jgi:hypothetical protein
MDCPVETAKKGDISPSHTPAAGPYHVDKFRTLCSPFHPAANPHTKRELPLSWYSSAEKKYLDDLCPKILSPIPSPMSLSCISLREVKKRERKKGSVTIEELFGWLR